MAQPRAPKLGGGGGLETGEGKRRQEVILNDFVCTCDALCPSQKKAKGKGLQAT